jgi:predicted amidophosphoribosyltransferase
MVSCGCLFCDYCYNQILKIKNPFCPNCKNQIEQNKSLNLKNPNQAKKISFLFLDPEKEIKKMMKALKYQKIQQKKYINFLENKIEVLLKENNSLKEIIKVSSMNNNNQKYNNNIYEKNNKRLNDSFDLKNTIDLSQVKQIKPKYGNYYKRINNNEKYVNNVNNLNIQNVNESINERNKIKLLNVNIQNPNYGDYSFNNLIMETPINTNNNNNIYRNNY